LTCQNVLKSYLSGSHLIQIKYLCTANEKWSQGSGRKLDNWRVSKYSARSKMNLSAPRSTRMPHSLPHSLSGTICTTIAVSLSHISPSRSHTLFKSLLGKQSWQTRAFWPGQQASFVVCSSLHGISYLQGQSVAVPWMHRYSTHTHTQTRSAHSHSPTNILMQCTQVP